MNNAIVSNPIGFEWTYDISGGQSMTSTSETINVELLPGQVINAQLTVRYANGCEFTVTDIIQARNAGTGDLEIINNAPSVCIGPNGQDVTFSANINPSLISTYNWVYTLSGQQSQTSTDPTITVLVFPRQAVDVSLMVTLTDGCTLQSSISFMPQSNPVLNIQVDEDCGDPNETIITLSDITSLVGFNISSREWIVDGQVVSNEPTIMIGVTNTPVTVQYNVVYGNGCTASFTGVFDPADYTPTADSEVECIGDGIFEFTYTGFIPECLELESVTWSINGMVFMGPVVQVELPPNTIITVEVTGTYSNGAEVTLSEEVDTNSFLDTVTFDIINNMPGTCLDTVDLSVDPALPGTYIWSDDPTFTNVLTIGPNFMGTQSELAGDSVYVQFITEDRCGLGEAVEVLDNNMVDIEFNMPFVICPGDTTMFEVSNLNADQDLTYLLSLIHI